jgi:hypothetical protein
MFDAEQCPAELTSLDARAKWFKRTGYREDVKFYGRVSCLVREEATALLAQKRITKVDLSRLAELWRMRADARAKHDN